MSEPMGYGVLGHGVLGHGVPCPYKDIHYPS